MNKKLMSPTGHAVGDYIFALATLTVPSLLGASKKNVQLYRLLALEVFLYGSLSKHRLALKPLIPPKTHLSIDLINLLGVAFLSRCEQIKMDKKMLYFNLTLLGVGLVNVLLTDWNKNDV